MAPSGRGDRDCTGSGTGRLLQKNPEICIVTNELGYGVVPIEPFDRKWREKTGRICTELAAKADSVTRVVCGIGILLKGEEKHD
ncbi:bifunctional adenosylcobinamide kinase/adenosylcobinamide-phosphate guanylyltransferase [Blautia sp. AF34-10]|uniref:bifunctional adenosylcobinamide kinase/adenosylcobinamide-phosphate guanylyltransferase n=1 Tax=Blautia sp. AF34-10 TaxID=2292968 RepID=UPI001FAA8619|nr:bifunctional adenosylcobinamide kinase/adenosylcobinamide-phosphate guanylyltransferase [Blautia sp. AF34-10]